MRADKLALYHTIVVTTDGSPFSWRAVKAGFELAKIDAAKLIVITVVDTSVYKDFLNGSDTERKRVEKELENNADRTLKKTGNLARDEGVDCEMILRRGRPHIEIIRVADDAEADLIVLGKGGSHSGDRLLMGGTSLRVIEDADCSVLVVK